MGKRRSGYTARYTSGKLYWQKAEGRKCERKMQKAEWQQTTFLLSAFLLYSCIRGKNNFTALVVSIDIGAKIRFN